MPHATDSAYFSRNITYGVIDSIVSTTGVLAGMAFAGIDRHVIVLTGIILIGTEATSMAFGAAISDEHFEKTGDGKVDPKRKWSSATVMLLAYALTGAVLLMPYYLMADARQATYVTATISGVGLYVLIQHFQGHKKASVSTVIGLSIIGLSMLAGKKLDSLGAGKT